MAFKVNNLTINSSVSREASNEDRDIEEKKLADKKSYLDDACQTAEQIKAEVLAECKQLIKRSIQSMKER